MNPNWAAEIQSSFLRHFDANRGDLPLAVKEVSQQENSDKWFELRFIGPNFKEVNNGYFVGFEIDALIQAHNLDDIYLMPRLTGKVSTIFTCVNVELSDLGVVTFYPEPNIIITNYNKFKEFPFFRSTVNGLYKAVLGV